MKTKSFIIIALLAAILISIFSCEEDFPKDEVLGNWQIHRFYYKNPDTAFSPDIFIHDTIIENLTPTDSLFDTITSRFGWFKVSLYEDLSLYAEEITGDSTYGYWERLTDEDIRIWMNGRSLELNKQDADNYIYYEYYLDNLYHQKLSRKVFWKRIN